ncbi:hypothetical protein JCM6882_000301 [Rhodosporidiobolus microsporus]
MASIPLTATAAVFPSAGGKVQLDPKYPVTQLNELKPGQVLVKLEYTGVCHTDLYVMKGETPVPAPFPIVGGNEGAGHVVAIADGTDTSLRVGDAVGIKWIADTCHECTYCHSGSEQFCARTQISGYFQPGTFQQYVAAAARYVTRLPDGLALELAAPVLCAGVTTWRALKRANVGPGDWVVISGAGGGLGHLAVQYAVQSGYKVIAIDADDKRALCEGYGVHTFLDFRKFAKGEMADEVKKICGGIGAHAVLVCATGGGVYGQALEFLRPAGTLVAVALGANTKIEAEVFSFIGKGLNIAGSYVGTRQDAIEALEWVASGKVKPEIVLDKLENLQQVLERMEQGKVSGRVVLKC